MFTLPLKEWQPRWIAYSKYQRLYVILEERRRAKLAEENLEMQKKELGISK